MTPYQYRQLQKKMTKVYRFLHLSKLFLKYVVSELLLVVVTFLMIVGLITVPVVISVILSNI